ncbi:MAG: alanine racemase [Planctomycetota bacterium]|nr:alanine racemase [Planctomycetota bacterium]
MSNKAPVPPRDETTAETLREIARRYGTPTYAFDVRRMRAQVDHLRRFLPESVQVLYSLKANASLGLCEVYRDCGIGADVASAGELETAYAAGFDPENIFVAGPFKLPETIAQLRHLNEATVSVDSLSELEWLSEKGLANPAVLRLRPDFGSCAVVAAGSESRFGFTDDQLKRVRERLPSLSFNVIGFHVFAGSQVLDTENLCGHLRHALDLSLRAADHLGIVPELFNLGGGFGIPYGQTDATPDLARVGEELSRLADQAAPARLVLELGRYLVAESGWYLTSVMGHQTFQCRPAVVVDGGTHQRADMCGLYLRTKAHPPVALTTNQTDLTPTDVLGCLSLPADVLTEASLLPALSRGDVLAFGNAGAYGIWSSPALFHGSPLPAEVAFDGATIHVMRQRKPAHSILNDQQHILERTLAAHS